MMRTRRGVVSGGASQAVVVVGFALRAARPKTLAAARSQSAHQLWRRDVLAAPAVISDTFQSGSGRMVVMPLGGRGRLCEASHNFLFQNQLRNRGKDKLRHG